VEPVIAQILEMIPNVSRPDHIFHIALIPIQFHKVDKDVDIHVPKIMQAPCHHEDFTDATFSVRL
jgi:hypothetical protein